MLECCGASSPMWCRCPVTITDPELIKILRSPPKPLNLLTPEGLTEQEWKDMLKVERDE